MLPPDPVHPIRVHAGNYASSVEQADARLADRSEAGARALLVSLADVARLLGVSKATAERMKSSARLPRHIELSGQLHRWRREEIERWIASGCPPRKEWEARSGRNRA
jgi:predicted DNA-binding transcriptional regulator AlpA